MNKFEQLNPNDKQLFFEQLAETVASKQNDGLLHRALFEAYQRNAESDYHHTKEERGFLGVMRFCAEIESIIKRKIPAQNAFSSLSKESKDIMIAALQGNDERKGYHKENLEVYKGIKSQLNRRDWAAFFATAFLVDGTRRLFKDSSVSAEYEPKLQRLRRQYKSAEKGIESDTKLLVEQEAGGAELRDRIRKRKQEVQELQRTIEGLEQAFNEEKGSGWLAMFEGIAGGGLTALALVLGADIYVSRSMLGEKEKKIDERISRLGKPLVEGVENYLIDMVTEHARNRGS